MSWNTVRWVLRVVSVLLVALVTLFLVLKYVDARSQGDWNSEANLWMALGAAAIGGAALRWPGIVSVIVFPFAVLWLLWALAYAGITFAAFVVGGVPLLICMLFLLAGRPRKTQERVPEE